ncbi:MAG: VWA domain-containing protein [Leptospirales bacterium]|nr:VWA domain-containing protein [Leptospirales bacterium]
MKILNLLLFVFIFTPLYGELMVLPYRVENPSGDFADDSGRQYAKLLSVALSIGSKIEIISQRDILADASRLGINLNGPLDADDLLNIGRTKGINYVLTGKIAKGGGKYVSESMLFSIKEARIVNKAKTSSSTLFELVRKDVHELFPLHEKTLPQYASAAVDMVFLIDCSYSVSNEWAFIKQGITEAASGFAQRGKTNFRIYLAPFSSDYGFDKVSVSESLPALAANLAKLKPSGTYTDAAFGASVRYAVKNILWRPGASRRIVIITNSPISSKGFNEQYGVTAKKSGLAVDSIILGKLTYDSAIQPLSISSASGGSGSYVSYHQRVVAADGTGRDVFFERGRIFFSRLFTEWRSGVLKGNAYQPALASPLEGLSEVHGDKKADDPYSLSSVYAARSGERIIDKGQLENNIVQLITASASKCRGEAGHAPAGVITISDGSASIMADVFDDADMRFFAAKSKTGEFFTLGVSLADDKDSPYGIRPAAVSRDFTQEDIPPLISVSIKDLVQKKDYYAANGFLNPPVWFIRVYVQNARQYFEKKDIRDE